MFTVYIDDSGTNNDSRIVTGACCVSTVGLWKKFERRWNEIGKDAGFKHFHMTEFAGCRPEEWCRDCKKGKKTAAHHPWREWSNNKRKSVLTDLAETANKYIEFGFGLAITKKDYEDFVLNSELRKLGTYVGERHYTFTIQSIAGRLAKWRSWRHIKQPMKYVFDGTDDLKQKNEIAGLFIMSADPEWKTRCDDGITPTGYAWESRKETKQLLSADMLAWVSAKVRAYELFPTGRMKDGIGKEAVIVNSIFRRGKKLESVWITREQMKVWSEKEIAIRKAKTE